MARLKKLRKTERELTYILVLPCGKIKKLLNSSAIECTWRVTKNIYTIEAIRKLAVFVLIHKFSCLKFVDTLKIPNY